MAQKVEQIRGPFDPGGQPETRSGNNMELGFFAWNLACGMTASKAVLADRERLRDFWHWDNAMHMNQLAERMGYEYQVPFARWRGYGGPSGYNDDSLDFLAAAACLAPVTSRLALFSTAHVTYKFHPVHVAKMGATIDFVSKGRWGSDEPIDFEGDYYQSYDALIRPRPVRQPRPVLMNAGNSAVGMDFACRHCDWAFLTGRTLEEYAQMVRNVHERAANYGRVVRPATMCYIIMAETDQAANDVVSWVQEEVDKEAINGFIFNLLSDPNTSFSQRYGDKVDPNDEWSGMGRDMFLNYAMGLGAWKLYGSYDTVAERIRGLREVGIESILTCFFDPIRGLHQMEDEVIPRLKKMGLRR